MCRQTVRRDAKPMATYSRSNGCLLLFMNSGRTFDPYRHVMVDVPNGPSRSRSVPVYTYQAGITVETWMGGAVYNYYTGIGTDP